MPTHPNGASRKSGLTRKDCGGGLLMMHKEAQFNEERTHRYTLLRHWSGNKPPVNLLMCNPSTADENVLDPTVKRCLDYAQRWGYGSLWVTNLFAFRSTEPEGLFDVNDPVGDENDYYIQFTANFCYERGGLTVCAWGSIPILRRILPIRAQQVKDMLRHSGAIQLYCLKQNKDGQPAHPLYLPKTLTPIPFDG